MVSFEHKQKSKRVDSFGHQCMEDTKDFMQRCPNCQKHEGITARNAMPLTCNLQVELFDVWDTDYMGPFPKSYNCEYILVAMDYVSKRFKVMPCRVADAKHAHKMFREIIFPRFDIPRIVINDGGSHHFINSAFRNFLKELGTKHNIKTSYHPQTSGQTTTSNKQIKNILQKTVDEMGKAWKLKLSDALRPYRTAYKTPIGMSPYQIIYRKTCISPTRRTGAQSTLGHPEMEYGSKTSRRAQKVPNLGVGKMEG